MSSSEAGGSFFSQPGNGHTLQTGALQSGNSTPPAVMPDLEVARYQRAESGTSALSYNQKVDLLRRRIKHVFILYQENRSFDHYFGTFPGADGLYSQPASETPGFDQPLIDTDGKTITIHPFRIGPDQYAADLSDVDHAHSAIVRKMHVVDGIPQMDRYALTEESNFFKPGSNPSVKAKQHGELAMAHVDGDTIPFLWRYANRFVLCDHIFQLMVGPSTPGNLSIIGAQTGVTQWMLHPEDAYSGNGDDGPGVPVLDDPDPFWGSKLDPTPPAQQPPYNPRDRAKGYTEFNLTYATLPLTLAGKRLGEMTKADRDPDNDLEDVADDVEAIAGSGKASVPWGWYEEGYDREPTDPNDGPTDAAGLHASYITHHNSPQYFGYIANNPQMTRSLHGLQDLFDALDHHTLPSRGVFYVKGGYKNIMGLLPADPDPAAQARFLGDDDHPGYSDAQISEALVAETVNKIARSPYWKDSAIIITWDDSEGDYDHVPPILRDFGPDGSPLSDGARVPMLVVSPYAKVHAVMHEIGDHASVVKFVDTVFDLLPLASLPDESLARLIGEMNGIDNAGPYDADMPDVTDLLAAFDDARLSGSTPALPGAYAEIPEDLVHTLPQKSGIGWHWVGIVPTDYQLGISNPLPTDFDARP